jgi:hypothetical protein
MSYPRLRDHRARDDPPPSMDHRKLDAVFRQTCRMLRPLVLLAAGGALLLYWPEITSRLAGLPCPDNALVSAAALDDVDGVKRALARRADPNARGTAGETPILLSAVAGNVGMIHLLLAHGADVNASTYAGYTPLHCAAYYGRMDAVVMLIENGADLNAIALRGSTPLRCAVVSGQWEMAELLRWYGALE